MGPHDGGRPESAQDPPGVKCSVCGLEASEGSLDCQRCGSEADRTWALEKPAWPEPTPSSMVRRRAKPAQSDVLFADVENTLRKVLEASSQHLDPLVEPANSESADSSSQLVLNRAERYEVMDTLGRGAMGLVLKVRDTALDEILALKVLDPDVGINDALIERFKQEVKIARRIHHPNVARIHDLFQWHHHMAISQEYIPGKDLDEVLHGKPMKPEPMLRYLRYICSALQAAHDIGVVHRDLKPSNIRVDTEDRPRILDFGLAVLTDTLQGEGGEWVLGTPSYMSPEQALSPDSIDQRADIYSLGVVLFRMATGRLPFRGSQPHELIDAHLHDPPPRPRSINPDVPPGVEDVILNCLAKRPEQRLGTAKAVYEGLRQAFNQRTAPRAAPTPAPARRGKVLLVDDNAPMRAIVRTHLEEINLTAIEATNGFEGIEAALAEKPDFILLDVLMPVLDGREALRILKSNPATMDIPVVMMTGLDDLEEEVLFRELGADMSLAKPIKQDILDLLFTKYVAKRQRDAEPALS